MSDLYPTRNEIISEAKSLPDLISKAEVFDPALAKRVQGESVASAGTIWSNISAMVVGWAVTRWGLGWDPQTCALVSGLLAAAATAVAHWLANRPLLGGAVSAGADSGAMLSGRDPGGIIIIPKGTSPLDIKPPAKP